MADDQKTLSEDIKSGKYFEQALDWYNSIYVRPIMERSLMGVFAFLALIAFLFCLSAFMDVFPLDAKIPFVLEVEDQHQYFLKIKSLAEVNAGKKGEEIHEPAPLAVAHYLVREYVQAREEYSTERLERNFKVVRAMSDDRTWQQFYSQMDTSNPLSPLVLYQWHTVRGIALKSVKLLDKNGQELPPGGIPAKAYVKFDAIVASATLEAQKSSWEANIDFTYVNNDVNMTGDDKKAPEFLVTGYNISPL